MRVWDIVENKYIEEKECGKKQLNFLYNTCIGRILLKTIVASRWLSKINGIYQKSRFSKKKIKKFIKEYNINMNQYQEIETYKSFDEFFTRKRNIKNDLNEEAYQNDKLIAIADSKLKVIDLTENCTFRIKQSIYNLKDLIENEDLCKEYQNGICLVYRLTVDDYHRYIFADDGFVEKEYYIKGKLHTVQSVSDKYKVYNRNSRNISILNTKNFGKILQIEVGAMLVGKINNHKINKFSRFDEKGYFEFGGSTIIQIIKKDNIKINNEIIKMSEKDIETKVKIGTVIGEK